MKTVHILKDKDLLEIAGGNFAEITVHDLHHKQLHFHKVGEGTFLVIHNTNFLFVTFNSDVAVTLSIGQLPKDSKIDIVDSGNVPVYVNGNQVYP